MLYFQERRPSPTNHVGIGRQISPYLIVDEEGLVPGEYVSLLPEEMIPVALEAEVEEPLAMEEGEEVIWFHVPPNEEEENQGEAQEEDCDWIQNMEEDDDDDEDNYEYTEKYTGSVNDHTYECTHDEAKEASGKAENEDEHQEVEDDINPN
ncbi:AABR07040789.1 [Phodopus roborovskii]|uniref:AABR07040789.1 protein n=1 Tax=Phodopus roborovskii TaxID=109678 RepID=A0AAU9Z0F1_PHORO|nr:AABR07040789.1 [Phodopus roborovskii]